MAGCLIKTFYVNIHWLIRVWHLFRQVHFTILLVVIKDYESVFDAFTLIYALVRLPDHDLQPHDLSITKINIFHQQTRLCMQVKRSPVQTTICAFNIFPS